MSTKILGVGAVQGQLEKAFTKIAKLHAKNEFAFALIVGDLFADEGSNDEVKKILDGQIAVPLPTYFTLGDVALPPTVQEKAEVDNEVCNNLFYVGRKGTLTTSEGVKICFLGGKEVQNEGSLTQSIGKYEPLFLENEARALQGAHTAHILLTSQWPSSIENGSSIPLPEAATPETRSTAVANLCATLKPRYHFSTSSSTSWKREPFVWPMDYSEDAETKVTRYEALGDISQKSSDWMSAFAIDITKPATSEGAQRAAPFATVSLRSKRRRDADADTYSQKRYDLSNDYHSRKKRRGLRHSYDPNDCFMCLGKPQFAAEMVVSIGEESFVTSLRGSLPTDATFPQLKSSGNLMIIPMYHAADESAHGRRAKPEIESEFQEMTRYRHALQHMLKARAKGELGAVCWEVNRTGIRHFHWQWIACPQEMIGKGLVEAAFKVAADKNEHEKFQACNPDKVLDVRQSDYFRVWIWSATSATINGHSTNGGTVIEEADAIAAGTEQTSKAPVGSSEMSMYFELPNDQKFNIQFGRTVMSGLLKLEQRADWRSVPIEAGDEGRDAEAWKEDFGEYDFAMS